jgi:Asp/Glu/hydantoin racemase
MKYIDISNLVDLLKQERAEKNEYKQWLANANALITTQSSTITRQAASITSLRDQLHEQLKLPVVGA